MSFGNKRKAKKNIKKSVSAYYQPAREHSKKPAEARKRIVELLGDLPRIELFARQRSPGWDAWGNEVDSSLDMDYRREQDETEKV